MARISYFARLTLVVVFAYLNFRILSVGVQLLAAGIVYKLHIVNPIVLYTGFQPTLVLVSAVFVVASLFKPKLSYAGIPLYIAQLALIGGLQQGYLATILAAIFLSHVYSYHVGGRAARIGLGRPRIRPKQYAVIALISAIVVAAPILVGLEYQRIIPVILSHSAGDVRIFLENLSNTLLFKLVLIGFAFYLVWKAVDAITSIASLALAPRASVLALYDVHEENRKAKSNLILFRGRQNGFLREALVLLFSLIFSPILFPLMRNLVVALGLTGNTATIAYLAISYAAGWILMRLSITALFDPLPMESLLKPRRARDYILIALILSGAIVGIAYLEGMNPVLLVESAITGKPLQPDPLANMIGIGKLENILNTYLETLYNGANAIVKYLWGG